MIIFSLYFSGRISTKSYTIRARLSRLQIFYPLLKIGVLYTFFPAISLQATRCRGIRQMPDHASMTVTFLIARVKTQVHIRGKSPETRLNWGFTR